MSDIQNKCNNILKHDNESNISKKILYFFASCLVLYEFTTYVNNDMIMPGMIAVVRDFHVSVEYVGLSLSFYILGSVMLHLFLGPLAQYYGRRRIILAGNCLFLLVNILAIFSHSIVQFLFWRVLQGMGLAFTAIGYSLIHDNFNDKDALKLTGLMGNITILAPLIGPMFGALIVSYLTWHFVFVITALMSLASLIGLYRYTPITASAKNMIANKPNDTHAGNNDGNSNNNGNNGILLNYLAVLKSTNFRKGVIAISLISLPSLAWIGLSPTLIIDRLHFSYIHYSMYQLIAIGGFSLSSIMLQFISGRVKIVNLIKLGNYSSVSGLMVFVLAILVTIIIGNYYSIVSLWLICLAFFVYGFGVGMCNSVLIRMLAADKSYVTHYAMILMQFFNNIVLVVGLALINKICQLFAFNFVCFAALIVLIGGSGCLITYFATHAYRDRQWS